MLTKFATDFLFFVGNVRYLLKRQTSLTCNVLQRNMATIHLFSEQCNHIRIFVHTFNDDENIQRNLYQIFFFFLQETYRYREKWLQSTYKLLQETRVAIHLFCQQSNKLRIFAHTFNNNENILAKFASDLLILKEMYQYHQKW